MKLSRTHTLGRQEARRRVDRLAGDLGKQLGVRSEWCGDVLEVRGSGVNGHVAVADDRVNVEVQLGFALKLMESTIRTAVENAMDRHLA